MSMMRKKRKKQILCESAIITYVTNGLLWKDKLYIVQNGYLNCNKPFKKKINKFKNFNGI